MATVEKADGELLNPLAELTRVVPAVEEESPTETSNIQQQTEATVREILQRWVDSKNDTGEALSPEELTQSLTLERNNHLSYATRGLRGLPGYMKHLDASRPWLAFWMLHTVDLLRANSILPTIFKNQAADFLRRCKSPTGGFGGGPGQLAHLAPTYAATMALMTIGTKRAYDAFDRKTLYEFLMRMKQPDGSFTCHQDGEGDVRATYCCVSVASLLNLLTPELTQGTGDWIASLQTYEGGIAGEYGDEAHGGYAFCGLAALIILGEADKIDISLFLTWAAHRQMPVSGGFQGRTNKLVDGCYSYWVGGLFPLIHELLQTQSQTNPQLATPPKDHWLYDNQQLQKWLLVCCQDPNGGLVDKPPKRSDFYHTCYTLSGMTHAQRGPDNSSQQLGVSKENTLAENNCLYNISEANYQKCVAYFRELETPDMWESSKPTTATGSSEEKTDSGDGLKPAPTTRRRQSRDDSQNGSVEG